MSEMSLAERGWTGSFAKSVQNQMERTLHAGALLRRGGAQGGDCCRREKLRMRRRGSYFTRKGSWYEFSVAGWFVSS